MVNRHSIERSLHELHRRWAHLAKRRDRTAAETRWVHKAARVVQELLDENEAVAARRIRRIDRTFETATRDRT